MIALWMISATLFAALLGVAAHALERALRLLGRESRVPWLAALAGAIAWPVLAPWAARLVNAPAGATTVAAISAVPSAARVIVGELPALPSDWSSRVDAVLLACWVCVSVLMLARLAFALRALSRLERSAKRDVVQGVPVLVTRSVGPAVFGVRRPRMLVPQWLLDLDAPLRALVLRHEQEHCRARDPQLTLGAAVAVALVPWNPGAWWIARRLRLALELDCDVRVMRDARDARDPQRYGRLLLFIAQRQSHTRLAPMLAESNSHLSRRITAMNASRPNQPAVRVATLGLVAAVALALACSPRIASDLTGPKPTAGAALTNLSPNSGPTFFDFQVEKPVSHAPNSAAPRFPSILRSAGVEGEVLVSYVVDTTGVADPASFKVLRSTHELFTHAVRNALPDMRFVPAEIRGRKVKQLVQQPFVFAIAGNGAANAAGAKPSAAGIYKLGAVIVTVPDLRPAGPKLPR